ncbi:S8 family serine peptidase [Mycoplasma sp. AC157]
MKNKFKYLFATSTLVGSAIIFGLSNSKQILVTENNWYKTFKNEKLVLRKNSLNKLNNENKEIIFNNNFEFKLLLNYDMSDYDKYDEDFFEIKNKQFIEKIKLLKYNFHSFKISSIMPVVWFYFNNEDERENFVKMIINEEEIYSAILFENNHNSKLKNTYTKNKTIEDYYYKIDRKFENNNHKFINFEKQKERENKRNYHNIGKIGILETKGKLNLEEMHYFEKNGFEIFVPENNQILDSHHAHEVTAIASGSEGVDRYSKLFFSTFYTNAEWQKSIEWLVKNNVKIINHSYGSINDLLDSKYDENNFFLDYISRKYGVVNVFSSGNGNENRDTSNEWINGNKISINNIVVGALDYDYWNKTSTDEIAPYSNYMVLNKYKDYTKPNITAPGYLYSRKNMMKNGTFYDSEYIHNGTSFAAPLVSGMISTLLREKRFLDTDSVRVQAIKAIIGASGRKPKVSDLEYKNNGYSLKYGSGIADFEKMLEAADNLVTKSITKNDKDFVLYSKEFYVEKNKLIKGASSWLFNAGILKNRENKPQYNPHVNWWWLLGFAGGLISNGIEATRIKIETEEWNKTHIDEGRLKLETTLSKQNDSLFSDYDLILEKKSSDGNWVKIKSIISNSSSDELLEYQTQSEGVYRFKIKKYSDRLFDNSIDDALALTYTIQ